MKSFLLFSLVVCTIVTNAQYKQPIGGNPLSQSQIIQLNNPSLGADKIYSSTLRWLATTYGSGKDVIDLEDKTNNIIIAKPIIKTAWKANFVRMEPMTIRYTLTIEIKAGKLRVTADSYLYYNDYMPSVTTTITDDSDPQFSGTNKFLQKRAWMAAREASHSDFQSTVTSLSASIEAIATVKEW